MEDDAGREFTVVSVFDGRKMLLVKPGGQPDRITTCVGLESNNATATQVTSHRHQLSLKDLPSP